MTLSGMFISLVVSGLLAIYWRFVVKDRLSLGISRLLLLLSIGVTFFAPFAHMVQSSAIFTTYLPEISIGHQISGWVPQGRSEWGWPAYSILLIGAGVQFLPFVVTLFKTAKWKREGDREDYLGFPVVISSSVKSPCTFLGTAYLPLLGTTEKEIILLHEVAHLRLNHKWDALFVLLARMFLWWNPFFWLLHSDLRLIHEKQADHLATRGVDCAHYKELLVHHAVHGRFAFTHHYSLTHQISERMKNLNTMEKSSTAWSMVSMLFILFIGTSSVFAQESQALDTKEVDVVPILAGCEEGDMSCFISTIGRHVGANIEVPHNLPIEEEGKFWIEFNINERAKVVDVKIVRSPSECEDDETGACQSLFNNIREALSTLTVERAAMKDGKFVTVKYAIPINVQME